MSYLEEANAGDGQPDSDSHRVPVLLGGGNPPPFVLFDDVSWHLASQDLGIKQLGLNDLGPRRHLAPTLRPSPLVSAWRDGGFGRGSASSEASMALRAAGIAILPFPAAVTPATAAPGVSLQP